MEGEPISKFFEFAYESLPHKELEAEKFRNELVALSTRFNDPKDPQYIWKEFYKTDTPAEGLPDFARKIWSVIKEDKDLDLPSEKKTLAMFRCESIYKELFNEFTRKIHSAQEQLNQKNPQVVVNFGKDMATFKNAAIGNFLFFASFLFCSFFGLQRLTWREQSTMTLR